VNKAKKISLEETMTPTTCAQNIFDTIDFSIKTSKDNKFIQKMKKLKEKITYVFENFSQDVSQIRKQIKQSILTSDLYSGFKQKIEKLLKKLK
jgi:hypothetical protein